MRSIPQHWMRPAPRVVALAASVLLAAACQGPDGNGLEPGVIIDASCAERRAEPPSERAEQGLQAVADRDQEIYPQLVTGARATIGTRINFGEAITDGIVHFRIPAEPASIDVDSDGEWLRDPEHPESITEHDAADLGWVALELACEAGYDGVRAEYVDY